MRFTYRDAPAIEQQIDLAAGEHDRRLTLRFGPAGADPLETTEAADAGPSTLAYVAWSVGAAGLILGGVTGGLALSGTADLEHDCPGQSCPADRQSDIDSITTLSHTSTVGFVVGGAAVAGGLLLWLISGGEPEAAEHGAALSPLIGPGLFGLKGAF